LRRAELPLIFVAAMLGRPSRLINRGKRIFIEASSMGQAWLIVLVQRNSNNSLAANYEMDEDLAWIFTFSTPIYSGKRQNLPAISCCGP
jgi:hypothetical protein